MSTPATEWATAPRDVLRATALAVDEGGGRSMSGVDLVVRSGEIWFLVGAKGSGRSALLSTLVGLREPVAGSLDRHPDLASPDAIGYVPAAASLSADVATTVAEFVSLGLVGLKDDPGRPRVRLARALEIVGLAEAGDRDFNRLPDGARQRALIARALIRRPRLLVLDRPTTELDPTHIAAVLEELVSLQRGEELTVLLATDDIDLAARFATHVALVHAGSLVCGLAGEVLAPDTLEALFGARKHALDGAIVETVRRTLAGHA